jgi:excisionase family DNA binding protein
MAGFDRLLTAREVADISRLQLDTIYRLARRGQLRFVKVTNRLRFREGDLRRWLEASSGASPSVGLNRPSTVKRPGHSRSLSPSPSPGRTARRGGPS